jgi:hypothetical protein
VSRIRSIHPGLWTDEAFVTLTPIARLFFMGIWNECDDAGSFEWSPLKLKMRILPADNADAAELLAELLGADTVMQYEVGGKRYGAVRNFCQYQRPKKPNSTYPQTDEVRKWVNTEARSTRDGSGEVGKELPTGGENPRQMEDGGDKGKREDPPKPPRKRRGGEGKTYLPDDWTPPPIADLTPKARACAELWERASYETVAEAFVLYWRRVHKPMSDWPATWCGWIIREHAKVMRDQKFGNAPPAANDTPAKPMTDADRAAYLAKLESSPWANGGTPRAEQPRANGGRVRSFGQLAAGIAESVQ